MIQFDCTGLRWSMRLGNTHWDWSPKNHFLFQLFLWQVAFVVWLCIHLLLWAGQVYLCNWSCTVDRCKLRTNLTIVLNSESLNYFPTQLCLRQNITTTQVWGSFTRVDLPHHLEIKGVLFKTKGWIQLRSVLCLRISESDRTFGKNEEGTPTQQRGESDINFFLLAILWNLILCFLYVCTCHVSATFLSNVRNQIKHTF